jgi:benzoyl-CoA reductase/2-hydroxyglutaryl-CoA dehydratase subunit BcrC/BadD/HgdB
VTEPYIVASWPSVPVEIVRAAGLRPTFAQGFGDPTPIADSCLEPQIFPSRLRHLVEAARAGLLRGASRIVIPRTSDVDYKCFLYLREFIRSEAASALPPVVLFDLLQSHSDDVRAFDVARTHALVEELGSASGRMPSDDELRHEITRTNAARAAARRLQALRWITPRVTGTEAFPLLAAFWEMEPDEYVALAGDAAQDIAARPPLTGPRVLLSGAPVDDPGLHQAIESRGAVVVAEAGPWGSGAPGDDVRCDDDPIAALADKYRTDVMGPRTPVDTLRRWTEQMLDHVDAVVVSLPPDDAVFGWDYPRLRDVLLGRGIPHVSLRGSPYESPTDADHARLDAMVSAAARVQEPSRG